jgi:hypothetical protein
MSRCSPQPVSVPLPRGRSTLTLGKNSITVTSGALPDGNSRSPSLEHTAARVTICGAGARWSRPPESILNFPPRTGSGEFRDSRYPQAIGRSSPAVTQDFGNSERSELRQFAFDQFCVIRCENAAKRAQLLITFRRGLLSRESAPFRAAPPSRITGRDWPHKATNQPSAFPEPPFGLARYTASRCSFSRRSN